MGSQRVGHDWVTNTFTSLSFCYKILLSSTLYAKWKKAETVGKIPSASMSLYGARKGQRRVSFSIIFLPVSLKSALFNRTFCDDRSSIPALSNMVILATGGYAAFEMWSVQQQKN